MGGIWTGVIVAQIAATVTFTGVAYVLQVQSARVASVETAFPAEEYLAVRLEMDRGNPAGQSDDYAATIRELKRRLASTTSVVGATLADRLPSSGSPSVPSRWTKREPGTHSAERARPPSTSMPC